MGGFKVTFRIGNLDVPNFRELTGIVGTGSVHTFIPARLLEELQITPCSKRTFLLSDNSAVEYDFGFVEMQLNGETFAVPVVFAPEGADLILGSIALDTFGLGVDWVNERLIPVPMMLKRLHN